MGDLIFIIVMIGEELGQGTVWDLVVFVLNKRQFLLTSLFSLQLHFFLKQAP